MSAVEQRLSAVLPGSVAGGSASVVAQSRTRLHELPVGVRAVVGSPTAIDGTIVRLLEMGLTPGVEVELTRTGIGCDPIEIRVRGTRVCLRKADADRFPVTLVGDVG